MRVELTFIGMRGLEAGERLVAELTKALKELRDWSENKSPAFGKLAFDESCGVGVSIDTNVIQLEIDTRR